MSPPEVTMPRVRPEKADDDTAEMDRLIEQTRAIKGSEKTSVEEPDEPDYVVPDEPELIRDEDEQIGAPSEDEGPKEDEPTDALVEASSRGVDLKKIREKYADFAKTPEFRELRNAYYRESQYTELFPTLDDAREAAENNNTFEVLNQSLVGRGDPTPLLEAVKGASPDNFRRMALSFLDTLNKLDPQVYVQTVDPLVRRVAKQMHQAGRRALGSDPNSTVGNALVATARNVMQFYFDSADEINRDEPVVMTQPTGQLSEREQDLQNREQAILRSNFDGAYRVCHQSVERNLDAQITAGLDPDQKLSEFTREALLEKIKAEVEQQVSADQSHLKRMHSLWKRAEATGYSRESLSRIVSAYLERARPIIPAVRTKYRSRAIGGRVEEPTEESSSGPRLVRSGKSGRAPSEVSRGGTVRAADPKKIDYAHTSDEDIFEGRVKLKG